MYLYKVLLPYGSLQSNISTEAYFINNINSFSVDSVSHTNSNMSRRAPSLTPSDAPPPYEDENTPSHHFSSQPEQRDSRIPLDPTRHGSTASTSAGSSSEAAAPKGIIAKLKQKREALKQNLDEGIARGHSDEGAMLANRWSSQHIYASLGVPVASLEKWEEHKDKKREKKEFDDINKDLVWDEGGTGKREFRGGPS